MFTLLRLFLAKKNDLIHRVVQTLFCAPGAQMPVWRPPSRATWMQHLPGLGVWLQASTGGGVRNCWGADSCSPLPPIPPRSHGRSRAKPDGISPRAGFGLQLELSDFIAWR